MSAFIMAPLALSPASAQIFGFGLGAPGLNQQAQPAAQQPAPPAQAQAGAQQVGAPAASEQTGKGHHSRAHRAAKPAARATVQVEERVAEPATGRSHKARPSSRKALASAPALKRTWKHRAVAKAGEDASEGSGLPAGAPVSTDEKPVPGDKSYSFKETRQWIARSAR